MNISEQHLLDLANESKTVKEYLGIPKDWDNIVKITNNSVHRLVGFKEDGTAIINAQFVGTRKYKDRLTTNQMIRLVEGGAFKHLGKRFGMEAYYDSVYSFTPKMDKAAFLTTGDLKPQASPGDTTCDGSHNYYNAGGVSWATLVATSTATATSDTGINTAGAPRIRVASGGGTWERIGYAHMGFDTSSIGEGGICTDVTLQFYNQSSGDTIGSQELALVSSSPASNTALVNSDMGNYGSTDLATRIGSVGSISTVAYTTFTGNAAMNSHISVTGVTNIGMAIGAVVDNSEPSASSLQQVYCQFYMADNGSNEPILNVTYSSGPAASRRNVIIT